MLYPKCRCTQEASNVRTLNVTVSLPKAKDYTLQTAKVWHELKDPPKKLGLCEDKTTGTGLSQPIRFCVWVWILILVGHDMI